MSKKMLKRSMALGALMAFVITGSAMAAEGVNVTEADNTGTSGLKVTEDTTSDNAVANENFINISGRANVQNIYIKVGYARVGISAEANYNTATVSDEAVVDGYIHVGEAKGKISAKANDNTVTVSDNAKINNYIYVGRAEGSVNGASVEANSNIATVSDNAVINSYIYVGRAEGSVNGASVEANENEITVEGKATVKKHIVAGYASGVCNVNANSNIVNLEGNAKVGNVFGAYATTSSQNNSSSIEAVGNTVNISDTVTVTASTDDSPNYYMDKASGIYGAYVYGHSGLGKTEATVKDNIVNVTGGTIDADIYGAYAYAYNGTGKSENAVAVADGNTVNLIGGTINGNVYGGFSEGFVSDHDTSYDGGGSLILGSVVGFASNNTISLQGDVDVSDANLYGNNGGEGEGNTLNIKGGWEGSIGSAQNFNAINITEGAKATFKTVLNDANVAVNVKGATWNVDKTNTIGSASFDASSVLSIDGATFEAKDGNNVYALNGSGELKVTNGATLAIKGIEYVKYNVAEGFTSIVDGNGNNFADGAEYWKLENTLMEGVWTTDNGLQVQIQAKKAEDLAEDMGVSVNIANTMTEIINIANEKKGTITEGSPEANVVDFANELANAAPKVAGQAVEAVAKMSEEVGQSAIAASIVKNVSEITNDRLSFNCGHSAPQKGGYGVGLFEEGSGADIWVEYVHGKDEVEGMKSTAGATSYEGSYDGIVMGVDFKKVGKFQSGIAFNYGEGDTNSVGSLTRTHSDYDFWGVGYYGNIHNDDSNVIFDINYAKTDSDVTQKNLTGDIEASPETTTWTAGVKVEKLYQNENVRIVPYTGLRYMSIDPDDYSTNCGTYNYKMERKDIWLLPVGVSIKQEVANDNGWTVSPRVDLSYIWAFGDTDSNMGFGHALDNKITNIGYDVMDDGSFLGLVGIEAHKGQWGYGIAYSYQKGDYSTSKKWFIDANYSF